MRQIPLEDGTLLVRAARSIVSEFLNDRQWIDVEFEDRFHEKSGVFVTINDRVGLRGCIGYVMPDREMHVTLRDAAVAAATEDPRFSPLLHEELDAVTFEVTILTSPEKIRVKHPEQYLREIMVGRDGLIVSNGSRSGLLLPQVPVEYGWNEEEFLGHACEKAGLSRDCWKDPETKVQRFGGMVFKEDSPNGDVIEGKL